MSFSSALLRSLLLAGTCALAQDLNLYGQVKSTTGSRLPGVRVSLQTQGATTQASFLGAWAMNTLPVVSSSSLGGSSQGASSALSSSAPGSSSSLESISSSSSAQASSTLSRMAGAGFAAYLSPSNGLMQLNLGEQAAVRLEAIDLQGRRALLFQGVAAAGRHELRPLQSAALQASSGLVVLRLQMGSQMVTWQVNHLRSEVLSVRLQENAARPVRTSAANTVLVALEAASQQPADVLNFSLEGYAPYALPINDYLGESVGTVFLAPLAANVVSDPELPELATLRLLPSLDFEYLYTRKLYKVGDVVTLCMVPNAENVVLDGLRLSGVDYGTESLNEGATLCMDVVLGAGENTVEVLSHRATETDSVTWTTVFSDQELNRVDIYGAEISRYSVPNGESIRLPRGRQFNVCATPAYPYRVSAIELEQSPVSKSSSAVGDVCLLAITSADENILVTAQARDSVTLHFLVRPGLNVNAYQENFDKTILQGDSFTYTVQASTVDAVFERKTLAPSQDTTIDTYAFDPTHFYRVTFEPSSHVTYSYERGGSWIQGASVLVPAGLPQSVGVRADAGWRLATLSEPGILGSAPWIPTADTRVVAVAEPKVPSSADSMMLVVDDDVTFAQFGGYARNQLTIPKSNSVNSTMALAIYKPGFVPAGLKVNGVEQPLPRRDDGSLLYFTTARADTPVVKVPVGISVRTLEVLFAPIADSLTLAIHTGLPLQGETVTITSTLQGALTLPAKVPALSSLTVLVTPPAGMEVYDLRLGNRNIYNRISLWVDRAYLGLDPAATQLDFSYRLRPKRFAVYQLAPGLDPANFKNTSQKRTLADNDTLWDGEAASWTYHAANPGEYLVGARYSNNKTGSTQVYASAVSDTYWGADGAVRSISNYMELMGIESGDTVLYTPIIRKIPAWLRFQDTTSADSIGYLISGSTDARLGQKYPTLKGAQVSLVPTLVPAGKILHLYVDGALYPTGQIPVPWLPDTTADTLVVDLKPVLRDKDSLFIRVESPRPIYLGKQLQYGPLPSYLLQTVGDTLRRAEGDTVTLCHGGKMGHVTQGLQWPIVIWDIDSLRCFNYALPVFAPSLAGQDHGAFSLTFSPLAPTANLVRTVSIQSPLAGTYLQQASTQKRYADGDTLQGSGYFAANLCTGQTLTDTSVYYTYAFADVQGAALYTGQFGAEKPCSPSQTWDLTAAKTLGLDTLKISIAQKSRARIQLKMEEPLRTRISSAFAIYDSKNIAASWNDQGDLGLSLFENYTGSMQLCFVPHDSVSIDSLALGGKKIVTSQRLYNQAWSYCVNMDSSLWRAPYVTGGQLTVGASIRSLPRIAFADSTATIEKVHNDAHSHAAVEYLAPDIRHSIYVSNSDAGSTITAFIVGGKRIAATYAEALYSSVSSFYYDAANMATDSQNRIVIEYERTAN